jgi:hypothetical protein
MQTVYIFHGNLSPFAEATTDYAKKGARFQVPGSREEHSSPGTWPLEPGPLLGVIYGYFLIETVKYVVVR